MTSISALSEQTLLPSLQATNAAKSETEERIEQQKIEFLNILLTQLENQNPLDPMDTSEYTNQLIQYSQLEQQLETNEGVKDLNTATQSNASIMALSYVDQRVELQTNIAPAQDNNATWNYFVEGQASDVKLTVTKEDGTVIYNDDGSTSIGSQTFELDTSALNVSEGEALYLSIAATDTVGGEDQRLNVSTTSVATIDGVTGDGTNTFLTSGTLTFRVSDILKITEQSSGV
jgi:flagellar basal-body rod modification protein FlgD